jgi:hypothetical protein
MANRRFIDFPIAASVGNDDIVLIWQDGLNKQTTKATLFAGSPNSLAGLTDVDISALANGQILQYNSTTSKWENVDRTDIDLDQLGDVTIVSPTNGQVLVYNSSTSKWENSSAGFVPYTGAVTTVNLGAQSILAGSFVKAGGTSAQFLKADGSVDSTAYGTGSVTSVALTMPTAFSVAGSPVTTAGTLAVTATGTTAQYIRGDGSLATFPALTGFVPYTGATADVNLGTHDLTAERGTFENNGSSDTLTVNHTSGSGYGIKVTKGGNNEALYVSKTSGSGNAMTVIGGRTSLVDLALSSVTNTAGDFLTLSGGVVHKRTAAEVRTDIGAGTVTSVAALTLGTSGTDLSSTVANGTTTPVITLNVPTASATNRGALSSADWSTFNNKQNALTLTTTGTSGAATLVGSTLNIPQYQAAGTYVTSVTASSPLGSSGGTTPNITIGQASGSQGGFLSSTDWTTFNNKQNALTNPVTGTGTTNYLPKFTGSTTIGNSPIYVTNGGDVYLNNAAALFFGPTSVTYLIGSTTNMTFAVNDSLRMSIFSNGNVSISNSPTDASFKLDVNGTFRASNGDFINGGQDGSLGSVVRISTTNTNGNARNWAIVNTWDNFGDLTFRVSNAQGGNALSAGSTKMVILSGGNVGIGVPTPNSTLQVSGSVSFSHTTKSANYTLTASDYTVGFDCASNRTANLPDATTCAGRIYVIYQYNTNSASRSVTLDGSGSQTIDGVTTYNLIGTSDFSSVMIQSNGSNWIVLADKLYYFV